MGDIFRIQSSHKATHSQKVKPLLVSNTKENGNLTIDKAKVGAFTITEISIWESGRLTRSMDEVSTFLKKVESTRENGQRI